MERYSRIESFVDHQDAETFFETTLVEFAKDGWTIQDGSGINFVNFQWRVGMMFERETNGKEAALWKSIDDEVFFDEGDGSGVRPELQGAVPAGGPLDEV